MERTLRVRTVDGIHEASIDVDEEVLISDILVEAQRQWNLPATVDYAIRSAAKNGQLPLNSSLKSAGVTDGDVLELMPLYEAGRC